MSTHDHDTEDAPDTTVDEAVSDKSSELIDGFGLPADVAGMAANDQLSKRRRKPASNDVDTQRAEAAQAEAEKE